MSPFPALEQTARDVEAYDAAVGQRGLAAWTESARGECPASVGIGETRRLGYTYMGVSNGGLFNAETATEFQRG